MSGQETLPEIKGDISWCSWIYQEHIKILNVHTMNKPV